jgi:RNA polymerase sigma-70 factor (ECF subfamily)
MDHQESNERGNDRDLALLERWRAGDARAGNELFERHFESVYRFFANKARADAADLVQRTFLGCVEARDRFRAASSFRTFLFAIARYELLGYWRRRAPAADETASSMSEVAPSPSAALIERHEHRILLEALRGIPLELQIAIELHYWEQLATPEIAEILEIPVGTAKSRLRRARESLLAKIAELETDADRLSTTLANLDAWAAALKRLVLDDTS